MIMAVAEKMEKTESKPAIAVLDCKGCGACDFICPVGAIIKTSKKTKIDYEKCTGCLKCVEKCPNKAIIVMF